MVAEVTERDWADSPVKQPQNDVGSATEDDAINDRAGHEGLAPHEGTDSFFRHIGKVVDDDWRFNEETADSHIQVEEDRPEKGEERTTHNTGNSVSTERTGDEPGDQHAKTEGGKEIHDKAERETTCDSLVLSADAEKPD